MEARREGKRQKTGKGRYSTCEYRTVLRNTCQLHLPSPATVHLAFQSSLRKGWLSFPEHCHLLFKRGTSPAWTGSSASSSWLPGAIISTTTYPVSSFWISQKGLAISGPEFSLFEEDTVFVFDLNSSKHWQMLVFSRQVCNLFLPPQPHTAGLWQSSYTQAMFSTHLCFCSSVTLVENTQVCLRNTPQVTKTQPQQNPVCKKTCLYSSTVADSHSTWFPLEWFCFLRSLSSTELVTTRPVHSPVTMATREPLGLCWVREVNSQWTTKSPSVSIPSSGADVAPERSGAAVAVWRTLGDRQRGRWK